MLFLIDNVTETWKFILLSLFCYQLIKLDDPSWKFYDRDSRVFHSIHFLIEVA